MWLYHVSSGPPGVEMRQMHMPTIHDSIDVRHARTFRWQCAKVNKTEAVRDAHETSSLWLKRDSCAYTSDKSQADAFGRAAVRLSVSLFPSSSSRATRVMFACTTCLPSTPFAGNAAAWASPMGALCKWVFAHIAHNAFGVARM